MKYSVANFKIACTEELLQTARDLLADAAGEVGFEAFEETPDGLRGYVQRGKLNRNALDEELETFPLPNVRISYTIQEVEDRNWNESWEATGFSPIDIAGTITIYDAAHALPDIPHTDITIGIEARQAFGTGTHQTTRMVIAALLNAHPAGKRVLDCGCGSGILGIAASKLGADRVWAYDIDDWSVRNAHHNSTLNHIDNIKIQLGDADLLANTDETFDIIMANINRNILLKDMPAFVRVMHKDSILILSGFYENDSTTLLNRASELGLTQIAEGTEDHWVCLTLQRTGTSPHYR